MTFDKKKVLKIFIALIVIFLLCLSINLSLKLIKTWKDPELFRNWIDSFGVISPLAYIVIVIIQILIPFIPGEPMEIAAGYAFGSIEGTILCIIAESLASIIVVMIVRRYGRRLVLYFFDKEKVGSLKLIQNSKRNIIIYTILFLVPGTPKDLLCYCIGLTKINIKVLFLITTLCRIPSIITSTLLGGGLGDKNYIFTIIIFAIGALLSLSGILVFNKYKNEESL